MSSHPKKILLAAGGTGGHLFPAQALAEKLLEKDPTLKLQFAAANLSKSAYFDKTKFSYCDISSMTPFRGGLIQSLYSIGTLLKGVRESLHILKEQKPDLVVGFGSFHSFPVLCAAALKRIPIVLFESNAIPGKVVRLFAKRALFTGIFFPETQKHLKGESIDVEIPNKNAHVKIPQEMARSQLALNPQQLTLLAFGGSQGAKGLNQHLFDLIVLLHQKQLSFQLIHFTGNAEMTTLMTALCQRLNIPCYLRDFEPRMYLAWSAADIVICRAGATTLSELLHYEVPGILIPYPHAADQHQLKNAQFVEKEIKAAITLEEKTLSAELIAEHLFPLISANSSELEQRKAAIKAFKAQQQKKDLTSLILEFLNG